MNKPHHITHRIRKGFLLGIGSISVVLGVVGIILPVLPTTPFLLLAAACYVRSSERFYAWLITNQWLGEYIKNYQEGRGMPRRTKIVVITMLWLTISYSTIVVVPVVIGKVALLVIAAWVTYYLTCRVKTYDPAGQPDAVASDE